MFTDITAHRLCRGPRNTPCERAKMPKGGLFKPREYRELTTSKNNFGIRGPGPEKVHIGAAQRIV